MTSLQSVLARHPGVRELVYPAIRFSGILQAWKRISRRRPVIIYFHDVESSGPGSVPLKTPHLALSARLFSTLILLLKRSYRVVGLEEAVASSSSEFAAITFDDGFRGVYDTAFPLLVKHELPATVFVVSDFIGSDKVPWWDELLFRIRAFRARPKADQLGVIQAHGGRWRALLEEDRSEANLVELYKYEDDETRMSLHAILEDGGPALPRDGQRRYISEEEIQRMSARGIRFGAHTKSHRLLSWLDDRAAREEIEGSKKRVQELAGGSSIWFAYPDGLFSPRDVDLVRQAGYGGAVQTYRFPLRTGRFEVPRTGIVAGGIADRRSRFSVTKSRVTLSGYTHRKMIHAAGLRGHRSERGDGRFR